MKSHLSLTFITLLSSLASCQEAVGDCKDCVPNPVDQSRFDELRDEPYFLYCSFTSPDSNGYNCKCSAMHFGRLFKCKALCHPDDICKCKSRPTEECWKSEDYTIERVEYNFGEKEVHDLPPKLVGRKIIPNNSSLPHKVTFTVRENIGTTSHFSHTGGISISAGIKFKTGIPFFAEGDVSLDTTANYEYNTGRSETKLTSFTTEYPCEAAPFKYMECKVIMREARITVPYTILLKHKQTQCICPGSTGIWTGIQSFHTRFVPQERDLKIGDLKK